MVEARSHGSFVIANDQGLFNLAVIYLRMTRDLYAFRIIVNVDEHRVGHTVMVFQ